MIVITDMPVAGPLLRFIITIVMPMMAAPSMRCAAFSGA
jgi:hypothetical protein